VRGPAKKVSAGAEGRRVPEPDEILALLRAEGTQAEAGRVPTREEIVALLTAGDADTDALYRAADAVRAGHVGDTVHLRAIIEFSNHCVQNCLYCGLRRNNRRLFRYRMSPDEIFAAAAVARDQGYRTVVLQSGEDPGYPTSELARLVHRLKDQLDVAVTLSVGELPRVVYRELRTAGADRYLLKHETADPALFARLRPGTTLAGRLEKLVWLRELGYQVGSGNMVGLPGQTVESLAADVILLRELEVEMAGIGPFIPHPDTPLAGAPPGPLELTLDVLAVTRLVLPRAHLPATTAMSVLHPEGRQRALACGANVVMPDLTPEPYRRHYEIYPGRTAAPVGAPRSFAAWRETLAGLGRPVDSGYGHGPGRN